MRVAKESEYGIMKVQNDDLIHFKQQKAKELDSPWLLLHHIADAMARLVAAKNRQKPI